MTKNRQANEDAAHEYAAHEYAAHKTLKEIRDRKSEIRNQPCMADTL